MRLVVHEHLSLATPALSHGESCSTLVLEQTQTKPVTKVQWLLVLEQKHCLCAGKKIQRLSCKFREPFVS